ncbi:MAG: LAGLIDADG family homing endonuclease [Candidatus Rokuibacteriota bacterium]
MAAQGITGTAADQIAHAITSFALYGFPECVVGETRVIDADTGRWVKIEDVVNGTVPLSSTLACDTNLQLRRRRVLQATRSGQRKVYRLRTALGREIVATPEHPMLTAMGWQALAALRPGDHIATARALPSGGHARWPCHHLIVLADLIAGGNLRHPSTMYFYTTDAGCCAEFVGAVEQFENTRATVARHRNCYSVHVRRRDPSRPIGAVEWAKRLGLWGRNVRTKRLPAEVFELHQADLGLLLARLWEGDGSLSVRGHAAYDTASRQLAEEVQHVLLRLGIVSRIYERHRRYRDRYVTGFVVTITGRGSLMRFYRRIGRRFLNADKRAMARTLAGSGADARMSRDTVPVSVPTGLSTRAICSPDTSKRGYRRGVIARPARYFDSPELTRLAKSDLYWDRITAIEPVGIRETYDLEIENEHNFLANDLVVHNSHASSFALLAYASAYLKAHHPAAFYAALLNNQPMGFYHPATIVKDAQRHGLTIQPVDVTRSDWLCMVETDDRDSDRVENRSRAGFRRGAGVAKPGCPRPVQSVRLGLRYVKGLRESVGRAIVTTRGERPFASLADLARRAGLARDELMTLAATGALDALNGTRRAALWQAARPVLPGLLVDAEPPADPSPLCEMSIAERLDEDYAGTGITLGPHPLALLRSALARQGVARAGDLARLGHGRPVRVAGSVIVRQRPGTAKGFVFLSLEDETGIANVIVTPQLFDRQRLALVAAPYLVVDGVVQMQDGVVSVRARRIRPLPGPGRAVPSHDFG